MSFKEFLICLILGGILILVIGVQYCCIKREQKKRQQEHENMRRTYQERVKGDLRKHKDNCSDGT